MERGSICSLFFFGPGFWPSAPHLQSALYDSNKKKILDDLGLEPRKKNGPGPDEKKPPQLKAVRVLS